jgi:hypothetical protein
MSPALSAALESEGELEALGDPGCWIVGRAAQPFAQVRANRVDRVVPHALDCRREPIVPCGGDPLERVVHRA